jgi:hypothetical protein
VGLQDLASLSDNQVAGLRGPDLARLESILEKLWTAASLSDLPFLHENGSAGSQ